MEHREKRESISTHILTKRMTLSSISSYLQKLYFNSHPHEEDDCIYCVWYCLIYISTHILTKRMTRYGVSDTKSNSISTHILTKRTTETLPKISTGQSKFNSHPHEEDDAQPFVIKDERLTISTHILTKRMTCSLSFRLGM